MTKLFNVETFLEGLPALDLSSKGINVDEADVAFVLDNMNDDLIANVIPAFVSMAMARGLPQTIVCMATFFMLVGYGLSKLED